MPNPNGLIDRLTKNFHDDAVIVVGVSGGPDSMVLLHLLRDLNEQRGWSLRLHVAHLNHELRGQESDDDAAFVARAASALGLPCTIESRNIAQRSHELGLSIETTARRERYDFFARVCQATGAQAVAVAHHADDNAETILHRILRGTGLRGLKGMAPSRPLFDGSPIRLLRPLLNTTRGEILVYLTERGIAFREDQSNRSVEPTRNRLRNSILPLLARETNPRVKEALIRLGEQARWIDEHLRDEVLTTFDRVAATNREGGRLRTLTLDAAALTRGSRLVRTEVIREAYRRFARGERDLTFDQVTAVLNGLSNENERIRLDLPGRVTVERRQDHLVFFLGDEQEPDPSGDEATVLLPGETAIPSQRLAIHCLVHELAADEDSMAYRSNQPHMEALDFAVLRPPLTVRQRRPGDRFVPLGSAGSQKLSDFFTNRKVDRLIRNRTPLVCDERGPIWIVGHRIDDRVKLTPRTRRILRIVARPLDS